MLSHNPHTNFIRIQPIIASQFKPRPSFSSNCSAVVKSKTLHTCSHHTKPAHPREPACTSLTPSAYHSPLMQLPVCPPQYHCPPYPHHPLISPPDHDRKEADTNTAASARAARKVRARNSIPMWIPDGSGCAQTRSCGS